ncbi:unnamed protein product [Ilex paraguariensis]|uniref:Wall-associated receptor kinase-like 14 n=1 Tax=Ilex paraguariensis TaxID=185542 RepID=A0ABC8TQJ8_9AQUA
MCVLPSILAYTPNRCNRSCGTVQSKHLPFPFGFSSGCQIRLNCTKNGTMVIDDFPVQQVTSDSILVNLPAQCGRPVETLHHLFSPNYAPTSHNGILLQNCSTPLTACLIPTTMVQTHFELLDCGSKDDNISCYSEQNNRSLFIDYYNLTRSRCRSLFSAISVVSLGGINSSAVSLEVQVVQLGWWLEGLCQCSDHAHCTKIFPPVNDRLGYRCQCLEGYRGDGYRAGLGCRKESTACNPSKYLSGRCGGTTRIGALIGASLLILVQCHTDGYRCQCLEGYRGDGYRAGLGCRKESTACNPSKYLSGRCGGTTRIGALIGGLKAVDFLRPPNEVNLANLAIEKIGKGCLEEIIDPFLEPDTDAWTLSSMHKVAEMAFRCLSFHRDMRPSMMEVAIELEQIRLSRWVSSEENITASSEVSSCSSTSNLSEKPLGLTVKKPELESGLFASMNSMDSVKDYSFISVQDLWPSEQSSPSSNRLLSNVIQ